MTVGASCDHEPVIEMRTFTGLVESLICDCRKCGRTVTFFLPQPRLLAPLPDNVIPLPRRAA